MVVVSVALIYNGPVKRQYLGDSKDSFKWDYHDYLATELQYPQFTVALMLTPDDRGGNGNTKAECFPARTAVLRFCGELRRNRDIERIKELPVYTGAKCHVVLHKGASRPIDRADYFSGFDSARDQIVFADPDNGFEPEKTCDEKHIAYADVGSILAQLNEVSVLSVFHHFRRISFPVDFAGIRARLGNCRYSTAVYWHSLMFVAVATSKRTIARVVQTNQKYAIDHPVKIIP